MKKKLLMIITALMMTVGVVAVAPKAEVKAATNYAAMNYSELVGFWSAQPLFDTIYQAEKDKSDYASVIKENKVEYFKASLSDYANRPASVQATRPLTYNYMRDVLALSDPNMINYLKGCYPAGDNLWNKVRAEVKSHMWWASDDEVKAVTDQVVNRLACENVKSVSDYDNWKGARGGRDAYIVYSFKCSPYYRNPYYYYGRYWNPWDYASYAEMKKAIDAYNKALAIKQAKEAEDAAKYEAYQAALAYQQLQAQQTAEQMAAIQSAQEQQAYATYEMALQAQAQQYQQHVEAQQVAEQAQNEQAALAYAYALAQANAQ